MRIFQGAVFCIIVYVAWLLSVPEAAAQSSNPFLDRTFSLLLWPEVNGWIASSTNPNYIKNELQTGWHDSHLPTYLGASIQLMEVGSLKEYSDVITNQEPACIEGDPYYIENEINKRDRLYIPILIKNIDSHSAYPRNGEIVFRSGEPDWRLSLGIVHPFFPLGGAMQIQYWIDRTGIPPNWIALDSTAEVLRHFLAGSIQAAAVPEGTMQKFLQQVGKEDLTSNFYSITVSSSGSPTCIYLQHAHYNNLLHRTLITETWLRDHFPGRLTPLPASYRADKQAVDVIKK